MNRGDITECCYVPRKPGKRAEARERQDAAPEIRNGDARLERLERLVLSLAKHNGIDDQALLHSSDSSVTRNKETSSSIERHTELQHLDTNLLDSRATELNRVIQNPVSNNRCVSVDEAPWVTLLNEVGHNQLHPKCLRLKCIRWVSTKNIRYLSRINPTQVTSCSVCLG